MNRRSLTLFVISASLIAGACAGKIHVDASVPTPPVAIIEDVEVATLPFSPLRFDDLLLPPQVAMEVAPLPEPEPGCDLTARIDEARALLDSVPVTVGQKTYRYTERRAGSTITFRDPEKVIGLALMDAETCELSTTTLTKRGEDAISERGFVIEPVTRINGIRWNNWATELSVEEPSGQIVVVLKYPYLRDERVARTTTNKAGKRVTVYDTKRVVVPVYYTPYSKELHVPELVNGGEHYLEDLAARAYEDLRERGVPSESVPGTLVADVPALRPEFVIRLAPNEHMDMTEFLLDPTWTTERIHIVIGANRERVATYTCSKASACGLMQFTPGTYAFMRQRYPGADLMKSFDEGARDQFNAMKAAILLHDHNTAQLVSAFGPEIMQDDRLEEYLAAAYNTGVGRVIAVLTIAKKKNLADWADAHGSKKIEKLLTETKGYIAKLRFLRDQWKPASLAKAVPTTPDI